MRKSRWLAPADQSSAVYHCYSRVVDRRLILGDAEKELFRSLMLEIANFCQVRILTFCIMSNHFHILVEVPKPPACLPSVDETLEAIAQLTGTQDVGSMRQQIQAFRDAGDREAEALWLARQNARRWSLSNFMKVLKQRFSSIYNRKANRKGTLWEGRFGSVLVEGAGRALVTMAAYIDLNPVRARLVQNPEDYRWCGYGEAVAGKKAAAEGLKQIVRALLQSETVGDMETLESYRRHLFLEGNEAREAVGKDGRSVRGCLAHDAALRVLAERGKLPDAEYLRCRVRFFCDGAVFGSRTYVENIFQRCRERFGPRRKTGARPLRGMAQKGLFTARALRVDVFG